MTGNQDFFVKSIRSLKLALIVILRLPLFAICTALVCLLPELAPSALMARGLPLLTRHPGAPDAQIELNGPGSFSPPFSDAAGEGFVLYRCITGTRSRELVESLYFLKLRPGRTQGRLVISSSIPAQAYFNVTQGHGARDAHGAASDGQGGVFYLWSASVLRIGDGGRRLWPPLKVRGGKQGRLWKYPGVLYTTNLREKVRSATLDSDGMGHALVFWESDSGVRAQKIAPWGERQWGNEGILLSDRRNSRGGGVGDGRGGAIVMVARDKPGARAKLHFISPKGQIRRSIGSGITLDHSRPILKSDGIGGLLVLYIQPVVRGGKRLGGEVHLARFHPDSGRVYDRALSPILPDHLEPGGFYLNVGTRGTALVSWRHLAYHRKRPITLMPGIPAEPPEVKERIVRRMARVNRDGSFAFKPVRLELTPRAGYRRNDEGGIALLDAGEETLALLESLDPTTRRLVLFRQRIASDGSLASPGPGQAMITGEWDSFRPFLWKFSERPVAVYFRRKKIGKSKQRYEPILEWLGPVATSRIRADR